MIWSILLTIYVLGATAIFCHLAHAWHTESKNGIDFSDILVALAAGAIWPVVAPFWISSKIDNYIWKKNYVDIISGRKKWN